MFMILETLQNDLCIVNVAKIITIFAFHLTMYLLEK